MARSTFLVFLGTLSCARALKLREGANPIRKVVNLLQGIAAKVEAEGKKEQEMYDQFRCYCKKGKESLAQSIADAQAQIQQLTSSIKEQVSEKAQLESDVTQHKKDRDEAKMALEEAKVVRQKGLTEFQRDSAEMTNNIDAMTKAIEALQGGTSTAFLQTPLAAALKRMVVVADLAESDRQVVVSFLGNGDTSSSGQEDVYAPQSDEIIGILSQLKDSMVADFKQTTEDEAKAVEEFNELLEAKTKEIAALQKAIEEKSSRISEVTLEMVSGQADLADTSNQFQEDSSFLKDMEGTCANRAAEWQARSKTRSDELIAIADAVRLLNQDEALDLFKKTLPVASLLQLRQRHSARNIVRHQSRGRSLQAVVHKAQPNFANVIAMTDNMVALVAKEQQTDAEKVTYCRKELDYAEDQKRVLDQSISDCSKVITNTKATLDSLKEELASLASTIAALDEEVKESTTLRQQENADFKEEMVSNNGAKEILGVAKKRLLEFYNPDLVKTGNIALAAFGSFLQVDSEATDYSDYNADVAPMQAPETKSENYEKKTEETTGVIALMDALTADITKSGVEAEMAEKHAQAAYEKFMKDAEEKRSITMKQSAEKEGQKADAEAMLEKVQRVRQSRRQELSANEKFTISLHEDCDWLLQNIDVRKEARAAEIESLKQAKAVLSGANFGQ